jgi:endonuclease/exonuclease/phosphatase family metal-dependent hydrolase
MIANVNRAYSQETPISVMTFNIRFSNPADGINSWDNRKELVVQTLTNSMPDIIGMQEVLDSQYEFLNNNVKGYQGFGVGRDDGKKGGEFVPVFFRTERFSLVDKGTFWLSPTPEISGSVGWDAALTRICTWVRLSEFSSGFEFYFLNAHFDHMGDTARAESAKLILDFIEKETNGLPIILTGDFNCSPDDEPYRVFTVNGTGLTDACTIAGTEPECREGTYNGWGHEKNPQRIDMVFYKGNWEASSYEVLKIKESEMFVSDHWPVLVSLNTVTGDTTIVQTFTFDSISTRRAVFQFPEKGKRYEKILMYYTLKCDSLTPHDKYPCGEWDYTTYTRVFHRTGRIDSSSFDEPIEVVEQFEIGRFITPYGKRLDLGLNGFTWVYDVTDYEPLLHGKVDLQAANGQELLDLKFLFIEGIPPRDVISIRNIWPEGSYTYKELADNEKLQATSLRLQAEAESFMLRARISGHGHFGPLNCCEWDPKMHTYVLNGEKEFDWKVWRDCGMNPVHPQGGTWQFDRAGWCPGTFVDTYDFEITPFVQPGSTASIDYQIQPYDPDNGEEGGNYEMAMHLFEYSRPNYRLDLEISDILAPSKRHEYRRMNPLSLNPVIRVRNNGTDTIRKFIVHYGIEGSEPSIYEWQGSLGFMQSSSIILPKPSWTGITSGSTFKAEIITINDQADELESNNVYISDIEQPVILPSKFIIHVKTQGFGRGADNAYTITDEQGRIVAERLEFNDTTLYRDKIKLKPGAYNFTFTDKNEDGMIRHWWLFQEEPEKVGENGELKILDAKNNEIMNLGYDFAEKRTLQFFVGDPE